MIPEAYWRFFGRWWWVIIGFGVAGAGVAYLWIQAAPVEYRSRAVLELNYARDVDGDIIQDLKGLTFEALSRTAELGDIQSQQKLTEWLEASGYPGDTQLNGDSSHDFRVDIVPPRVRQKGAADPAFLTVNAYAGTPGGASLLATKAGEWYSTLMNDYYADSLDSLQQQRAAKAAQTEAGLKMTLAAKRNALLADDSGLGTLAVRELVNEHSRLLNELLVILGELRTEAGAANALRSDSQQPDGVLAALTQSQQPDRALAALTQKVQAVGSAWESTLRAPLDVLYSIESRPEYQLALLREEIFRTQYRELVQKFTTANNEIALRPNVSIVSLASAPVKVRVLGFGRRNILMAGTVGGLLVGWILASVLDQFANSRRRLEVPSDDVP